MKECTFKPCLPNEDLSKSSVSRVEPNSHRNKDLYSKAKHKPTRQDKTKEEYEFERQRDECTFQPQIKRKAVRHVPSESLTSVHQQKY